MELSKDENIDCFQTLGGPSTTIVFRRSIGVAFHSAERFCAGFFSAGTDGGVGSGNAAVFVSELFAGVATIEGTSAEVELDSLTGAAKTSGVGGITTEVASAGPATSGISSAETVGIEPTDAAVTTVGDGIDRISDSTTSEGWMLATASVGEG